jgi:DnaJ family protein C protein 3
MIIRTASLALGASLLLRSPLAYCVSPHDIPTDTPIASLVSSAKANLARGNANDALTYFDVAISRDPQNYLTIFQRGATFLSLGRNSNAEDDFNRVLSIKPDFEGALLQRAKIRSRRADWDAAKADYARAGQTQGEDYAQLEEAQGAAALAADAEKAGDYEACVSHVGTAVLVASTALSLRQLRAKCRFERGEIMEGTVDLQHVLQISPGSTEPHLQISSMLFYSLGETDKGLEQIRKCLHSDPDSKPCWKLNRQEKKIDKLLRQTQALQAKRQYSQAVKILVGSGEETGLMDLVKEDVKAGLEDKSIHQNAPNELYASLVEMACDFYGEVCISVPTGEDLRLTKPRWVTKTKRSPTAPKSSPSTRTPSRVSSPKPSG